jgi:hypothetical protein
MSEIWRFLRVLLLARFRSWSMLLGWIVLAVAVAGAGLSFGSEGIREFNESSLANSGFGWIDGAYAILTVLVAALGGVSAVDLICRDQKEEWLIPLVGVGARRSSYLLAAAASLIFEYILVYALILASYSIAVRSTDSHSSQSFAQWLVGGSGYVTSTVLYGLAFGVLIRRRMPAILLAITLGVLPYAATVAWTVATGDRPELVYRYLVFLYVPPPSLSVSWVGRHVGYSAVLLVVLALTSQKLLGRKS